MNEPTPDSALASLLAQHPNGFAVSANGQLTPASGHAITSLEQLRELSCAMKRFQFDINGNEVTLEVRPLREEEVAAIDKIGADLMPPQKFADAARKVPNGFDWEDRDYVTKATHAIELRRAAKIAIAIPALGIQPGPAEQQLEVLQKTLPKKIIDALGAAVDRLSTDPIQKASFI